MITINGAPQAQQRHRSFIRNGVIVNYDPQSAFKKTIQQLLLAKRTRPVASNPDVSYQVQLDFYVSPPRSKTKNCFNRMLWLDTPSVKPDVDNLAKLYLDSANGILWEDDKQISCLKVSKHYSEKPRTVIQVMEIKQVDVDDKANGILGIFSPDKFDQFLKDLETVLDSAKSLVNDPEKSREARATSAALFLSQLADNYGVELYKINAKFPNYFKEAK